MDRKMRFVSQYHAIFKMMILCLISAFSSSKTINHDDQYRIYLDRAF